MREAKQDEQLEIMGTDSAHSDELVRVIETCLSGRRCSSTGDRLSSFKQ
jgi:hypothetical protein